MPVSFREVVKKDQITWGISHKMRGTGGEELWSILGFVLAQQESRLTELRQVEWQPTIYDMVIGTRQSLRKVVHLATGDVFYSLSKWRSSAEGLEAVQISLIHLKFPRSHAMLLFSEGMGILKFLCMGNAKCTSLLHCSRALLNKHTHMHAHADTHTYTPSYPRIPQF